MLERPAICFILSTCCYSAKGDSTPYRSASIDMLRATEQLTWSATLDRFRRGYENVKPGAGGRSASNVSWELFSGDHLRCKVLAVQPRSRPFPPPPPGSLQDLNESTTFSVQSCVDRQLRIIVECGPNETADSTIEGQMDSTGSMLPSSSQSIAPLVPV